MHCQCKKCTDYYKNTCDGRQQTCTDNPCYCTCFEKPKVKGKFGVAYVLENSNKKCGPLGWQVEFEDTPSVVDLNFKRMMKWVKRPPLGDYWNTKPDFARCPEICSKFLNDMTQTCSEPEPVDSCHFIKKPKVKACSKPNRCICQMCGDKERLKSRCCRAATPECNFCGARKSDECRCLRTCQKEDLCTCSECCNYSTCNSLNNKSHYCNDNRNAENMCPCKNKQICPCCGKTFEEQYYENQDSCCIDDNLDHIPDRETSSQLALKCKDSLDVLKQKTGRSVDVAVSNTSLREKQKQKPKPKPKPKSKQKKD